MIQFAFMRQEGDERKLQAKVTAEFLPFLAAMVSKDEDMEDLTRMEIRPHRDGGVTLCALNGGILGLFHDVAGTCKKPLLVKLVPDMLKHCKGKWDDTTVRFLEIEDNGHASIRDSFGKPHFLVPDEDVVREGSFPDWRQLLSPAFAQVEPVGKPRALPADLKAFDFTTKRDGRALMLHPTSGDAEPVIVRHDAFPEFVGVVMPMRVGRESHLANPVPSWFEGAGIRDEAPAPEAQEAKKPEASAPKAKKPEAKTGKKAAKAA